MKIAVFATGWNGEYLRDMYHGLENSQKEFHDSIHLYASFGRLGSGDSFNKSEFDFFELADMEAYDGFLYPSTTVKEGDVKQRLLERIIESKKPCVSLEEEIPGLSFVGINQSKAMRQIVRHLAGVHGIRTFGFINGMKDTYEAQMRQQGVESKIRELGLCLMPEWVDYGNYEYRSGETYARKMIAAYEAGEELPQAVISANDLMAAAFLQTIKGTALEGKIPITGFDRYFDGECFSPTMTTIERPRDQVAYEAVRLLHELYEKADGKLVHRELSYRFFIGNTCGCTKHVPFDTESFRNRIFWKNLQEHDAKSKLDSMQEWVTSRISLEEIMDATGRFLDLVGAGRGQIFLTDDLFSQEAKSYRSCKREVLNWCNEKNRTEEGGVQVFMPLHYQLHRMGYCMVAGVDEMFRTGILETFFRNICYALENYIQRKQYQEVNLKLQKLYRIDQLTGIYNRFGMEDLGQKFYERNCEYHINTKFIFCDINRLKYINDTYGHKAGDWVIRKTGEALGRLAAEDSLPFRFGGDEFLLLTREESGITAESIRQSIAAVCKEEPSPIREPLEASIGVILAPWDSEYNMDVYLNQADEAMYEEKKMYHEKYGDRRRR